MSSALAPYVYEAEIVDGTVRVLVYARWPGLARSEYYVDEGQTVGEIVRGLNLPPRRDYMVSIDGEPVRHAWWERVRPHANHVLIIRGIPGGGGGDGSKGWIGLAAGVVLIVVGILFAVGTFGFGAAAAPYLITAGIGLILGGIVQLVMPPPQAPKLKEKAGDQATFAITGTRNSLNPYGAVPRVYGEHKIFPPFGALPYTEVVGNQQYLRQLFVVGYGPLELTDLRIGTTPIETYDEVELDIVYGYPDDSPLSLFPGDVFEDSLSINLARFATVKAETQPEPVRETRGAVDEWSVDVVFPSGLFHINGDGDMVSIGARINISTREVRDPPAAWTLVLDTTYTAATAFPVRKSFRYIAPRRAVYEIKVRQFDGGVGAGQLGAVTNAMTWAVLRSVVYRDPVALPGLCKIAMRIKATDQLNGVVDQFSCVARSILPDYDAETGTWVPRPTNNPAAVYRNILQGSATAVPLPDDRLDLAALATWSMECAADGRAFNFVVEQGTTVQELLKQVTAVGRASIGSVDGTFGVVRDIPQVTPVQHFTPRNTRDFAASKLFRDIPHAIKARFINPATEWEIDERLVYDDGYGPENATRFEAMQFFGVTNPDQAYRAARYTLAAAHLRPEIFEFSTDIEHLVCTRGDLIRLTHDVPLVGLGAARIKSVTLDGTGAATAITLDDAVPMVEDGTRYQVRIRRFDTSSLLAEVQPVEGKQTQLTFLAPLAPAPAPGDIVMFGTVGAESIELKVTRIQMLVDMSARISAVDAAPRIEDALSGAIPPYDPHITKAPEIDSLRHPAPILDDIQSGESVMVRDTRGVLQARIVLFLHFRSAPGQVVSEAIDLRWRRTDSGEEWTQSTFVVSGDATKIFLTPVEQGVAYDIRLRSTSTRTSQVSDWLEVLGYVVEGQLTPPPDVVSIVAEGRQLRWSYPIVPDDFAGFEIRRQRGSAPDWVSAVPIHDGLITNTSYLVGEDVGSVLYLVKGVDVNGISSVKAATVTIAHPPPATTNVLDTINKRADGWPGTHDGVVVGGVGGELHATSSTLFWPASDVAFWAPVASTLFWPASQFQGLHYITSTQVEPAQVPSGIWLDVAATAPSWDLAYRASGLEVFWVGLDADPFWARGT